MRVGECFNFIVVGTAKGVGRGCDDSVTENQHELFVKVRDVMVLIAKM